MDRVSEENVSRLENLLAAAESRAAAAELRIVELESKVAKLTAIVEDLTARLNNNPRNSNSPPSSEPPYKKPDSSRKGTKRPKGGQKGHTGHSREILPPNHESEILPVCECGSAEFKELRRAVLHQIVELPQPAIDVTHLHLMQGNCKACGKRRTASAPSSQSSGFGPNLTALVGELSGPMRLSRSRVQSLLSSLAGLHVSTGAIQAMINRVSGAILPLWERMGELARSRQANYIDETSWRKSGRKAWIWVLANRGASFYMVNPNRNMLAFKALIADWAGFLISDDFGTYMKWEHGRQTCLAHLLRLARGFAEHPNAKTRVSGTELLDLLEGVFRWSVDPPSDSEMEDLLSRLHDWCECHKQLEGKLGATARRLADNVLHLAAFLYLDGVEPTNNRAERALRFGVLWRKISFGSDSDSGCRWTERVLTLVASCDGFGQRTYPVLLDAVKSSFNGVQPDLTWATA
jgi:transposase